MLNDARNRWIRSLWTGSMSRIVWKEPVSGNESESGFASLQRRLSRIRQTAVHRKCEPYLCNTSSLGVQLHSRKVLDAGKRAPLSVSDGIHPLLVHQGDAHGFPDFLEGLQHLSNQNQIKSKSNHFYCHITTAQVPWWVKFLRACSRQCKKQQFTYGQCIFTDCTEDNVQNTHTYTQYTQCTIKTYLVINYTLYTVCAHLHYVHYLYIM